MMTEPRVADFLVRLATDSEMASRFMSDAGEARRLMNDAGVDDDAQRALGSGDLASVLAVLRAESPRTLGLNGAPQAMIKKKRKKKAPKKPPARKRPPAKPGRRKKPGSRKTAGRGGR